VDLMVTRLIFRESGGFAGLQRGCTVEPEALPERPRSELQGLVERPGHSGDLAAAPAQAASMPDMQTYTLELVMRAEPLPEHRVLHYPASDVPADVSALIGFLREHAKPL
jgi:hypothetical protein